MDAPSLVLLTPAARYPSFPGPSPSSSTSSTPEPPSIIDHGRSSSETSIPSIYSMYNDQRGSWAASNRLSKDTIGAPNGNGDPNLRNSYLQYDRPKSSVSVYYDAAPDTPIPPRRDLMKASTPPNGSPRVSLLDPGRPPSIQVSGIAENGDAIQVDDSWATIGQTFMSDDEPLSPASIYPSPVSDHEPLGDRSSRVVSKSRPNSQLRNSTVLLNGEPVIIPPTRTSSRPPSAAIGEPSTALSPQPSTPRPTSQFLLAPNTPPATPPKPNRAKPLPRSPESSRSIARSVAPSEGEDIDSFHVRSTYAQLDMTGVKGDGYEEGVERTRARVGGSRMSELRAEQAIGDGTEKAQELTPQEIELLSSVDRYGFFVIPSHDRLIRLPTSPLLKPLAHTTSTSGSCVPEATPVSSIPPASPSSKELSRIAKWSRMLLPATRDIGSNVETWTVKPSKERKLRERTYKGIPDRWRSAGWGMLMAKFSRTGKKEMDKWGAEYREALDKASSYDIQIDLDVPRTISGHIMFRTRYGSGQRSLFHVLHCFSLRCPDCGYCQGMGPIAATLLCYFDPERAYASLIRLHDAYSMHDIFQPGFPGLLEAIYVQERIMEQMMPGVFGAFKKHMISTTSYATKWYITLFANSVPFQMQLRLWDVFLLEGHDVFVIIAVAIVWVYRDHITSNQASFETVLSLLSSFFVPEDEDSLLFWIEKALADKKLRTSMTQWRQDWKQLVATGQDGKALL